MADDQLPKQHILDQSLAMVADSFPPFLWRFYNNLREAGFDEAQAFEIIKTWIDGSQKKDKT